MLSMSLRLQHIQASTGKVQKRAGRPRSADGAREPCQSSWTRRSVLWTATTGVLLGTEVERAQATKLGSAVDRAWEQLGGGPSDLTFPVDFLGTWQVHSTLVDIQTPLGEAEAAATIQGYERAKSELRQTVMYSVRFVNNDRGQVVMDRVFNTAEMLKPYYSDDLRLKERIRWDLNDPNALRVSLPGGMSISTLVTRRSQRAQLNEKRLETSELMRMVMDDPAEMNMARVLGTQCFTKYKWRSLEEARRVSGPSIVATQVVSEFPLSASTTEALPSFQPVVIYTYKMQLSSTNRQEG